MKTGTIEKQMTEITAKDLALINQYSRRELGAGEVYAFPLTLCDNETDRDGERFSIPALNTLAEMFLGKTGIFDHNPRAANQTARIYATDVVTDESRVTSAGEPYTRLSALAYMVRDERTAGIILDIDAGILKEVSVGVQATVENGVIVDPTDAYEWSFVAVPAQKNAGVTKQKEDGSAEIKKLRAMAEAGERFADSLRRDVVRFAALAQPEINAATLEAVVKKLDINELEELRRGFKKTAARFYPVAPQCADVKFSSVEADRQFKI